MSKFGELLDTKIPVVIDFFSESDKPSIMMNAVVRDVAIALGQQARVIKIDIDKNEELVNALRIKALPTVMIYKEGEMVWRHNGTIAAEELITLVKEYF